jgi:riboflavin synthase
MFTGIIQNIGTIACIDRKGDWAITVETSMPLNDAPIGASVACSGICLTLTDKGADFFNVQVSNETLSRTTASRWEVGTRLNLERALRMGDELGGHLVSGHVDGVARVIDKAPEGDSVRYLFDVPPEFARFLAPKGSVALDGISLTVNEVDGPRFSVNIIPHTQAATTIGERNVGDVMNFEVDMIARYVERLLPTSKA